jgi:hypothetical protein
MGEALHSFTHTRAVSFFNSSSNFFQIVLRTAAGSTFHDTAGQPAKASAQTI